MCARGEHEAKRPFEPFPGSPRIRMIDGGSLGCADSTRPCRWSDGEERRQTQTRRLRVERLEEGPRKPLPARRLRLRREMTQPPRRRSCRSTSTHRRRRQELLSPLRTRGAKAPVGETLCQTAHGGWTQSRGTLREALRLEIMAPWEHSLRGEFEQRFLEGILIARVAKSSAMPSEPCVDRQEEGLGREYGRGRSGRG